MKTEGDIEGLTTRVPGVYRVIWNRVSFLVMVTHGCAARVCYYHQKAAQDSIPHGKHLCTSYLTRLYPINF